MFLRAHNPGRRRGAIAPLTLALLVLLVGMAAFAVDTGTIVIARTQLQSAADAAALAGADPLMNGYVQYQLASSGAKPTILSNAMNSAKTYAKNFASHNSAGGVSGLVLFDNDIQFGFTDASGTFTAYNANSPVFPNTIKVTLRLDGTAGGNRAVGMSFAQILGPKTTPVTATAAATIMAGTVNSFNSVNGANIGTLPMTYDVNAWNNFITTGQWPDGTSATDSSGVPYLQVYPSVKDTGNFGQLSLNDSTIGDSTVKGWVDNGMAPSDLSALQSAGLLPLSGHNANSWNWLGSPGFESSLIQDVNNYPGKQFYLPLFTPYNANSSNYSPGVGQGSGYNYNIVQFVAVSIYVPPDNGNNNQAVYLQATAMVDPSAVFSSLAPAGTQPGLVTTFSYPRLSQ
jgi:hypothetical protein